MEANMREHANQMYELVCNELDERGWRFSKNEEKRQVIFITGDEDITISVGIGVDEVKQRIYLQSPMDIEVCEEKSLDMAIAVCEANSRMADGCLDYNVMDGTLGFRISVSLWDSKAGAGIMDYLLGSVYSVAARFNVMFDKLNKGEMSIDEFLAMNKSGFRKHMR